MRDDLKSNNIPDSTKNSVLAHAGVSQQAPQYQPSGYRDI